MAREGDRPAATTLQSDARIVRMQFQTVKDWNRYFLKGVAGPPVIPVGRFATPFTFYPRADQASANLTTVQTFADHSNPWERRRAGNKACWELQAHPSDLKPLP